MQRLPQFDCIAAVAGSGTSAFAAIPAALPERLRNGFVGKPLPYANKRLLQVAIVTVATVVQRCSWPTVSSVDVCSYGCQTYRSGVDSWQISPSFFRDQNGR